MLGSSLIDLRLSDRKTSFKANEIAYVQVLGKYLISISSDNNGRVDSWFDLTDKSWISFPILRDMLRNYVEAFIKGLLTHEINLIRAF